MPDQTLEAWLAERRAVHAAATEGPWRVGAEGSEGSRVNSDTGDLRADSRPILNCNGRVQPEDGSNARFVVDAHNTVPILLAMVEAVLELHQRDEHGQCTQCWDSVIGEIREDWPCAELRALEAVIGE